MEPLRGLMPQTPARQSHMADVFVSHENWANQIPLDYAEPALAIVFAYIALAIVCTVRRKPQPEPDSEPDRDPHFTHSSSNSLRGLAIIMLLLGHMAEKLVEGHSKYEHAGAWAVIIFLVTSGIVIAKSYGSSRAPLQFLRRRVRRLMFPLWLTFSLFCLLDYLLLNRTHSPLRLVLGFMGIIAPDPPNGPAWFITYIMYMYISVFIALVLKANRGWTFLIVLVWSYLGATVIMCTPLDNHALIWVQYSVLFPTSLLVGLYHKAIFSRLLRLYRWQPTVYWSGMLLLLALFKTNLGFWWLCRVIPNTTVSELVGTTRPVTLVLFVTMLGCLFDTVRFESKFLLFLGAYSFEIYLLHIPFMGYYDFVLFRRPLGLWFAVYAAFVILLSLGLKWAVERLNTMVSRLSRGSAGAAQSG